MDAENFAFTSEIPSFNESNSTMDPSEDALQPHQIAWLIWTVICLTFNVHLIYLIIRHQLCKSHYYFLIKHWSFANIFQMVDIMYLSAVPQANVTSQLGLIFDVYHKIISTIPVTFALVFIFDFFVNSKKMCRSTVYSVWITTFINILLTIISIIYGQFFDYLTTCVIIISGVVSVLILTVRALVFCIRPGQEEKFILRLSLSAFCVLSNFCIVPHILLVRHSSSILIVIFYNAFRFVTHSNGFINLLLLICFDRRLAEKFYLTCGSKQIHKKYSVRESIEERSKVGKYREDETSSYI